MSLKLSIIIVNYKTPELTTRCIESILDWYEGSFEIIVVDNLSNDESENFIISRFPFVKWIASTENVGFGRGNNLGIQHASGDYLLLINSDMLIQKGTIQTCLAYIESNIEIGVVGCKLLNDDGSYQKSVYHYVGDFMGVLKNNLLIDYLFKPKPGQIKAVMGAFMLIPRNVFDEVKGFDPDFFMYAEELDLCRRISRAGYRIKYLDAVTAIHKHGGSSDGSDWSARQNWLSNALLYLKVKGHAGYCIYHFLFLFNFTTNFLLLWKMESGYRKGFWNDSKYYFSNFGHYFLIPFLYKKTLGNGKRILKRT